MTEAIGVYQLLNNMEVQPQHPVTIVIADEVHGRTMYAQMIIGLGRLQMEANSSMVLILMSATVDVAELKTAIPGACEVKIDQHEFAVKRYYLSRNITSLENVLVLTARLIVTLHHECGHCNLVTCGQFTITSVQTECVERWRSSATEHFRPEWTTILRFSQNSRQTCDLGGQIAWLETRTSDTGLPRLESNAKNCAFLISVSLRAQTPNFADFGGFRHLRGIPWNSG